MIHCKTDIILIRVILIKFKYRIKIKVYKLKINEGILISLVVSTFEV